MNVTVAWEDVISIITQILFQLSIIGVALIVMIVAMVAVRKMEKSKKVFIRIQSVIAFLLVTVLMVNSMLLGPLRNTISAVMADIGELTEENRQNSYDLIEKVAGEGIVLAKNKDNLLPLKPQNINLFGWASTNPIYGGTGSGSIDTSVAVDILNGFEKAGFKVNSELVDLYKTYRADRPIISMFEGQDWTLPEVPASKYSNELLENAKTFSDTAVIVIGRPGGENADLPHDMKAVLDGSWAATGTSYMGASFTNNSSDYPEFEEGDTYLELSKSEKDLVDLVCSNFDNVVVVYNGSNTLEMGWTDQYEQIKSVILCPPAGTNGFSALGKIVSGEINPSGKTADTWLKDLTKAPYFNNIGNFVHTNTGELDKVLAENMMADGFTSFVNYVENIYVGYRFYETAAQEGLINYKDMVQYPFGYGLSYTTFEQKMSDIKEENNVISFDVTVTNTGNTAGKDVVEVYYNPPYTNGGIEKSSVNLIAFDKTDILEPGASQTINISFNKEDMASYDTYGHGCYVLEKGDYKIGIRKDSNTVLEEKVYTLANDIVYNEQNVRSTDKQVATNRFDFAEGDVTYLSRKDGFKNYEEVTKAPTDFELDGELIINSLYDPKEYINPDDVMPKTGERNGLELYDLRGVDYDDPKWDTLLDQIKIKEMVNLIGYGGFQTIAVDSIHKKSTVEADGPAGVNSFMLGVYGSGYCSEVLIAQTWNTDLAFEVGDGITKELIDFKINGWYSPSMNLHRSAFAGRNFEYYSECGVLSGKMAAATVKAATENGIYPYLKHFALNDQEINRTALLCTWLTEQSAREIYLKPFEVAVKSAEGKPMAMMSSFNMIGTQWAGACQALLNDVLRNEWGFKGMVLTDYFGDYGYMDADNAIRNGGDIMLGTTGGQAEVSDFSATSVQNMRRATKNILYTVVNSKAYESYDGFKVEPWIQLVHRIDTILALLFIGTEVLVIRKYIKRKTSQAN